MVCVARLGDGGFEFSKVVSGSGGAIDSAFPPLLGKSLIELEIASAMLVSLLSVVLIIGFDAGLVVESMVVV